MDLQRERYAEALRQAAETLGSSARLACFLGVENDQVERWLAGNEDVPLPIFLTTLDVIADGPYAPRKPRAAGVAA